MYPTTQAYKAAMNSPDRQMAIRATLQAGKQVFYLTGEDMAENTLRVKYGVVAGQDAAPGGAVMADLSLALVNDGRYDGVQLAGAVLNLRIGVKVTPDTYEWVPMGVFEIHDASRKVAVPGRPFRAISLQGKDRIIRFERPFAELGIGFPITAGNLLTLICQKCRVPLATADFPNREYVIDAAPDGDLSCRDMVAGIAALAGCWARCSRQGLLELGWFKNPGYVQESSLDGGSFNDVSDGDSADGGDFTNWTTQSCDGGGFADAAPDLVLDDTNRHDFQIEDTPITVTGLTMDTEEGTVLMGSSRYAIHIDCPLIQSNPQEALDGIYRRIIGLTYIPFRALMRDDPALDAGDFVLHTNVGGQQYRTVITEYQYVYNGRSAIAAAGTSEPQHAYKPAAQKQYARLLCKIGQKQKQLNALDDAILNASQLIAGMWGGFVVNGDTLEEKYHGNIFICDAKKPADAHKVWRWNLGGLGYSENGIDGPFTTAITADGSIVANLITANMIQTGLLRSLNGKSWINLDDGSLSLGDGSLKWDAANGFEAISAERLTNKNSDGTYMTIGKGPEDDDGYGQFLMHPTKGKLFELVPKDWMPGGSSFWIDSRYYGESVRHILASDETGHNMGYLTASDARVDLSWRSADGSNSTSIMLARDTIEFRVNNYFYGANGVIDGLLYSSGICLGRA